MNNSMLIADAPLQRHRHGVVLFLCVAFAAAIYVNSETSLPGAFWSQKFFDGHPTGRAAFRLPQRMVAAAERNESDDTANRDEKNRDALAQNLALLERGYERLAKTPAYTATFQKQERVDGELLDQQVMDIKLRHAPFSVYMKWTEGEVGRELLFVEGEHDGQMVIHPGGLRGRILPAIKLEPDCERSMAESRHPVTEAGLLNMTREVIERRKLDMKAGNAVRCEKLADQPIGGRQCDCYVVTWTDQSQSPVYRKSMHWIDKESSLLVGIRNYGWPEENESFISDKIDDGTLIEHYTYTNIQFGDTLAAIDFDHTNDDYNFQR